jgi:uncharacterized phiE125 gp8 family phage protein
VALKILTPPVIEPLTLDEVRLHLRLDTGTFANDISTIQSIILGSHAVAAAYSLLGVPIDVLGYSVVVDLICWTNGSGGTVDVKLQHSDNNSTWADVGSGAFTQITESNDNAIYQKTYTGTKKYLRAVATVATAACDFGVNIVRSGAAGVEDDLLTRLITAAREDCEDFQRRAYITRTYELWLDAWPDGDRIEIPMPILQAVNSVTYYDTNGDDYDLTEDDDFIVDTENEPGQVVLAYGKAWPSITLRPVNGICIEFDAGYGAAAADVPAAVKQAMLLLIGHLYENREAVTEKSTGVLPMAVESLLWKNRVF